MILEFHFWGVRGSIPVSNTTHSYFGGHTSCLEVRTKELQIFLDTGTGFQNTELQKNTPTIILFSHFHHDHIQGLLFGNSTFQLSDDVFISSALCSPAELKSTLSRYFGGPLFPVEIDQILNNVNFVEFEALNNLFSGSINLSNLSLNHPGGCAGYRIDTAEGSITSLVDNEVYPGQLTALNQFADGSDLVIWDAMFTEDELELHQGWGHSSIEAGIQFSTDANIKSLALSHHSPKRSDMEIHKMNGLELGEKCFWARENLKLLLDGRNIKIIEPIEPAEQISKI